VRAREDDPAGFDRAWWRRAAALGWSSLLVPEELGGVQVSGQGLVDLTLVMRELGRFVAPGPMIAVNVVADLLSRSGSAEQQRLLPAITDGERVPAWAYYEQGSPWSAPGIRLAAEPTAAGWVLSGAKSLVESGQVADLFLVTARSRDGLVQLLVPATAPGLTVENQSGLDLVRRYATVRLEHVEVPASALVGRPGSAEDLVRRQLEIAVVLQLAETVGVMETVFELTLAYLSDRLSFGRPLSSYQALKHRMADMKMWLEASAAISAAAARAVQEEAPGAGAEVSAAKAYVAERATDLIQDCVQLHGGIGVTWEHDLHLYLRRATVNRFTYGTPEEHRDQLAVASGCGA
jgi:alkylation response protein AidB-like acyl-CoA dehydrogenase